MSLRKRDIAKIGSHGLRSLARGTFGRRNRDEVSLCFGELSDSSQAKSDPRHCFYGAQAGRKSRALIPMLAGVGAIAGGTTVLATQTGLGLKILGIVLLLLGIVLLASPVLN